jgi:hypothetical protein
MKAVTTTGQDFIEASYKAPDGSLISGQWESLDAEAVAAGRPWRTFPWYLGQKNYAGWYWCATQSAHVGYESRLELSRLMLADFDPMARRIVSQPFQLRGMVGGERIRRVPDYLVCTDSGPLVIDVKPFRALQEPDVAHLLDVTRHVIESRGWRYEIASEPAKVEFTNVRFLAGCCSTIADGRYPTARSGGSSWPTPSPRSTNAPAAPTGAAAYAPPCWPITR